MVAANRHDFNRLIRAFACFIVFNIDVEHADNDSRQGRKTRMKLKSWIFIYDIFRF
jgi:hypothetical protein